MPLGAAPGTSPRRAFDGRSMLGGRKRVNFDPFSSAERQSSVKTGARPRRGAAGEGRGWGGAWPSKQARGRGGARPGQAVTTDGGAESLAPRCRRPIVSALGASYFFLVAALVLAVL